mmetsp:Transcript_866/g.3371  ORF Transcript_866/g.3371 Transcript_866/m.3371 type:complete len:219 (+) Transcript_866:344-1000(+)
MHGVERRVAGQRSTGGVAAAVIVERDDISELAGYLQPVAGDVPPPLGFGRRVQDGSFLPGRSSWTDNVRGRRRLLLRHDSRAPRHDFARGFLLFPAQQRTQRDAHTLEHSGVVIPVNPESVGLLDGDCGCGKLRRRPRVERAARIGRRGRPLRRRGRRGLMIPRRHVLIGEVNSVRGGVFLRRRRFRSLRGERLARQRVGRRRSASPAPPSVRRRRRL